MWHHFLLLCALLSSTIGQKSFLNYLLMAPALIEHPSTETMCVDIYGARETLNVTVTLHYRTQDDTLLQQEVIPPNFFKCVQFKSPNLNERKEEVISIHISIVGQNTQLSEKKNLLVRNIGLLTLIQTDKPVYKSGETVRIQVLTFNRDLLPVNDNVPLVEIQDTKKNRIAQWLNLSPDRGIIDVSFPLDNESQQGVYTINTPNAQQDFHVLEDELPKYEVRIILPTVVTILTKTFQLKTCVRYSFGKPVQGEIKVSLCRKALCYYWRAMKNKCFPDTCMEYAGRTDKSGCYEEEIQTEPYELNSYNYLMRFDVMASFKEDGTGTQANATSSCTISAMIAKVTFEDTESSDSYYKEGLRYKARIKLSSADGSAMKSQTLYVTEEYDSVITEHVYETDEKGEVCLTLDSRPWNGDTVYLKASYRKTKPERVVGVLNPYCIDAYKTLNPFNSFINSFIKVQPMDHDLTCDQEIPIEIDFLIRGSEILTQENILDLRYLVVARGNLVTHGVKKIHINRNSVTIGTMEVLLLVTANFSPLAQIFAYILPGNEQIIADSEEFQVSKCFNNEVTLAFADNEITPDSQTTLHINAEPGSLCSVKSVDESVLLLRPESDITSDVVYSLLAQRRMNNYPYRVREDNPICILQQWPYTAYSWAPDVFELLQSIGMKVLTNTQIRKPGPCLNYPPVAALSHNGAPDSEYSNSNIPSFIPVDETDVPFIYSSISASEMKTRIRKRFPETMISTLVTVGESGQAHIKVQVPDSITSWKATAFCMGDKGLGIANATTLKAFQPFFLLITHPNLVVRGEKFSIKFSLFNYLSNVMMVKITFHVPPELKVDECPTCTSPHCLYPEESIVFAWEVQALQVGIAEIVVSAEAIHTEEECRGERPIVPETGSSDVVMKTVKIKAEGMPVEKTHNSVLCAKGHFSSETIFIPTPPEAVPNSVTATFSIIGDIMGSLLQGIEKLLTLPSGCGEQNMAKFALNIHVHNYLESTNQMTDDIKQQVVTYLLQGYQRQMDFRRNDGSYCTFGSSDEDGNVWLTASVTKTLNAASHYISVDRKHIEEAVNWLKENQLPSGCFRNRGELFKSSSQGGLEDHIILTAFVTNALQEIIISENSFSAQDSTVPNALNYLRDNIPQVQSLYTKAVLAYTFSLSREYEIREMLLQELHDKAVNKDGEIYWPANPDKLDETSEWSKPDSNEVELASYVILAHLSSDTVSAKDINMASCIAKWMAHVRNPNGGFANTQDTLVGFQALALFSQMTYTKHEALKISLSTDKEGSLHYFYVDEKTRLLLQRKPLTNLPGSYRVEVEGAGCVFTQTSLKYNILHSEDRAAFEIDVVTRVENQAKPALNFTISVRYTGPCTASNMALVQVELPSGFIANKESLYKTTKGWVKRTETTESYVIFYISSLNKTFETVNFLAVEEFTVQNQKSKMINVFDYYNTGVEAFTMYDVPNYNTHTFYDYND